MGLFNKKKTAEGGTKKKKERVLYSVSFEQVCRLNQGESWETVFGKGVTAIGRSAFRNRHVEILPRLPEGIERIDDWAFAGCMRIHKSPRLPKTVTKIGANAFRGCSITDYMVIPESVKEIGEHAFADCRFLYCVVFKNRKAVDKEWLSEIGLEDFDIVQDGDDLVCGAPYGIKKYLDIKEKLNTTTKAENLREENEKLRKALAQAVASRLNDKEEVEEKESEKPKDAVFTAAEVDDILRDINKH